MRWIIEAGNRWAAKWCLVSGRFWGGLINEKWIFSLPDLRFWSHAACAPSKSSVLLGCFSEIQKNEFARSEMGEIRGKMKK